MVCRKRKATHRNGEEGGHSSNVTSNEVFDVKSDVKLAICRRIPTSNYSVLLAAKELLKSGLRSVSQSFVIGRGYAPLVAGMNYSIRYEEPQMSICVFCVSINYTINQGIGNFNNCYKILRLVSAEFPIKITKV